MQTIEMVIEELNSNSKLAQSAEFVTIGFEAARGSFLSKVDELLQLRAASSDVASGESINFLAAYEGFLLGEHEGGACVVARAEDAFTNPVFWTTRRALFVALCGTIEFQTYRLDRTVENQVFDKGTQLNEDKRVSATVGSGLHKGSNEIVTFRRAVNGPEKALIAAFYSKPFGPLDWIFGPSGKVEKAVMSFSKDTITEKVLEAFSIAQHGRRESPVTPQLIQLTKNDNYLVRWAALSALWQTGRHDEFVLKAIQSDPHPEISEQAKSFELELTEC